jgi:hypothetical protein
MLACGIDVHFGDVFWFVAFGARSSPGPKDYSFSGGRSGNRDEGDEGEEDEFHERQTDGALRRSASLGRTPHKIKAVFFPLEVTEFEALAVCQYVIYIIIIESIII